MKIAMICRELSWGIGTHTRSLAKYLRHLGVDVDIRTGKTNLGTNYLVKHLKPKYDIIHIQGTPFGALDSSGPNAKTPRVVTVHTLLKTEWKYSKKLSYLLGQIWERQTLKRADRVIIVNEILAEELKKYKIDLWDKLIHIPNGVDLEEFGKPYFFPRDDYVMSCGRNVKRKDFKTLERACWMINTPYKIFHGELTRDELIREYKTASMFVCTSRYETGPITVMEAMACGCPVICSAIPAVKGLIVDGVTGLLFRTGDAEDLANRISYLQVNQPFVRYLAQRAYYHILYNYNFEDIAKQTLKVYEEVIN